MGIAQGHRTRLMRILLFFLSLSDVLSLSGVRLRAPQIVRRCKPADCLFNNREPEPSEELPPISRLIDAMEAPTGFGGPDSKIGVPAPIALGFVAAPIGILILTIASLFILTPGRKSPFDFVDPFFPPAIAEQQQLKATRAAAEKKEAEKKAAEAEAKQQAEAAAATKNAAVAR